MVNNLTWIDVEAYWFAESYKGNVIKGTYKSGPKQGHDYEAIIQFVSGFWISKYSNIRYRQGIAERYVKSNEKEIIKVASKLLKKMDEYLEVGKLRRVGIQNTGIQSSKTASGRKYYPAGKEPKVILSFEGTYLTTNWAPTTQKLGKRPEAEVL